MSLEEDKNPVGAPLKFKTVEELDAAVKNYFDRCDPHTEKTLVESGQDKSGAPMYEPMTVLTTQKPYLMTGLARALGVSRRTLLNYKKRDEYFPSIQEALWRCAEYAESQLFTPYANGAKFSLSNNFSEDGDVGDWADKRQVDANVTVKDTAISGDQAEQLIRARAKRTNSQ